MAKSKKERRSSIRHMSSGGDDAFAIFEALDRAEREASPETREHHEDEDDDEDDPADDRQG